MNVIMPDLSIKFRDGYLKRLPKIVKECSLRLPFYKKSNQITEADLNNIDSLRKQDFGLPIILFPSKISPLLISTTGVFFEKTENQRGFYRWDELDFVAGSKLASDELVVSTTTDATRYKRHVPGWVAPIIYGAACIWLLFPYMFGDSTGIWDSFVNNFLAGILLIFLAVISPICIPLLSSVIRRAVSLYITTTDPNRQNILKIGPRQIVDLGFGQKASDVGECVILGLQIYRKQKDKYGG